VTAELPKIAPPPIPEDEFRSLFDQVERAIEARYGIPVRIRDVPNPFTGDLDGAEIHIDYDEDIASAFFILVHLFGHTVQWNLCARARDIGSRLAQSPDDALMRELLDYERVGARYSLGLLHSLGITALDGWLSDFSACDLRYLEHYYRTGEKRPFASFWRDGEPLIAPAPVPEFRPTRWVLRGEGIVV
jgi:hypothetical protein